MKAFTYFVTMLVSAATVDPLSAQPAAARNPQAVFEQNCGTCHTSGGDNGTPRIAPSRATLNR